MSSGALSSVVEFAETSDTSRDFKRDLPTREQHANMSTTAESNGTATPNGSVNGASQVPEWVEAQLFEGMLKNNVAKYMQIKSFKAKPALTAGENYATMMMSIEIDVELDDGQSKSLSYMMKVPIASMAAMLKDHNVFDVEASMYEEVVPEMEQLYRDAGVEVRFGAQYYDVKTPSEYGVICLEDLRTRGFKNVNRLEGLDMEHTKCVLKRMAQWHAASAVRVETRGKYHEMLMQGFFTDAHLDMMKQMQAAMSATFMACAKTYEGCEVYMDDLEKLQDKAIEELFRKVKIDPTEFNALNHGDCWCNNVMFRYDAFGKIKETLLVDFQIPKYGTVAQDLLYFLLSSTKLELKLKQFEYFVKYYYDNLIENLTLLKYPKKLPALKDIHIQLHKYGIWGYSTVVGIMAAVLVDPTEKANLENFLQDTEVGRDFKMLMYSNQRYRKHAEVILPWLHNRGALEC